MADLWKEDRLLEVSKEIYPQVISMGESVTVDPLIDALNAYGGVIWRKIFWKAKTANYKATHTWMDLNGHQSRPKGSEKSPHAGEQSKKNCQSPSSLSAEQV